MSKSTREKEARAEAERARQGKAAKKKPDSFDEYGNQRDLEGEADDDAKWAAAFEKEEREWREGDEYDENSGGIIPAGTKPRSKKRRSN